MAHGFTGQKTEHHRIFVQCSRRLAQDGIASLRFDFRYSGDSEGEFENTTISSQVADFKQAIMFAARMKMVDRKRIGALGLSMGSVVALESSLGNPLVKSLCLWAAIADPTQAFGNWLERGWFKRMNDGKYAVFYGLPPGYPEPGWILKNDFFTDLPTHKPLSYVKRLAKPLLVVHGDADEDIDVSASKALFERAKEPKKLVLVHGAGHVFFGNTQTEEALSQTLNFFKETLQRHSKPLSI
jgi:hypothetical protein